MPYIDQKRRNEVEPDLELISNLVDTPGDLNYVFTWLCHKYIKRFGKCYQTLNAVIGVLECAKAELLRQVVAPYENKKKRENGPVSELDSLTLEDVR